MLQIFLIEVLFQSDLFAHVAIMDNKIEGEIDIKKTKPLWPEVIALTFSLVSTYVPIVMVQETHTSQILKQFLGKGSASQMSYHHERVQMCALHSSTT